MRLATASLLTAVLALACSRRDGDEAARRIEAHDAAAHAETAFDFERPLSALALDADDVARRLGSFDWTAGVEWSLSRAGEDAQRVHVVERHRVRESATGDFEVSAEVDPGLGPGSEQGKELVRAGGNTYARAKYAAWRERPTDRGHDARLFRDESFRAPATLLRLCGGVAATPAGDATALGRAARRYRLALDPAAPPLAPAPRPAGAPAPDEDTARRLAFLDGRVPSSCDGELLLDGKTGAPLRVRLAAAFGVKGDPAVRATVELSAQVKALGGEVAAIVAPRAPLPDERKPAGVANALDAAGLRKKPDAAAAQPEPAEEQEDER